MQTFYEIRRHTATLIFDLEDRFARERGVRGPHPRPFEPLQFLVTAQGAGVNRREIKPPLEMVMERNGGGYHVFNNIIKHPDGSLRQRALADDTYDLNVKSSFYQRLELTNVALPSSNKAINSDLLPSYYYPFPADVRPSGGRGYALLRGSLHATDGSGIVGASVTAVGAIDLYFTDETGQWVLVFPDSLFGTNQTATITVQITPPTGPAVSVANVDIAKGDERALSETALRGWVLTNSGLGISGATVEVQGRPGQTSTAGDGSWFYYFNLNQAAATVDVTVRLADGRSQTQNNRQVQPRATVVVPPFRFL